VTGQKLIQRDLLAFYDRSRRDLPWRQSGNPYAVWVSEVMLQQTRVSTVLRYFPAWMTRFPSVRALAGAKEADVLHAWQGLGYYSRARRLHGAAKAVVERHGGELPSDPQALRALPGLGPYSAGAIASIAFGLPEPIVDGNVVRVLSRAFGLRGDPEKAPLKRALWKLARDLVPRRRPGDFNQALMELGATVCTPRAPLCDRCPLRARCVARSEGLVEKLPELKRREAPTQVRVAAAVVRARGRVLVVQVPDDAPRWAGLYTFPQVERAASEAAEDAAARAVREQAGLAVQVVQRSAIVNHTITRFRITLEAFDATVEVSKARPTGRASFVPPRRLGELAMPAPHRKLARLLFDAERT
jgi:A/G-specific adenine glycosylase